MAIPTSTYRLQISADFDLKAAAELCDYLDALGVGAVYCSPLLVASAGSDHGYDVVDHSQIDPVRGGRAGWLALLEAARDNGLGIVVDIVPNHAGVADAAENAQWWDLLRLGKKSDYASWFDVDWSRGKILLPVLGDDFEPSQLEVVDGELRYFEHRFPIAPGTGQGSTEEVHEAQNYELVNFRRADTEQNYRRFFAVTTLAGLRVEDDEVFDQTHAEILRWTGSDGIDGLRVDHPDGLLDPGGYLQHLHEAAPQAWITVEKILEPGEAMPTEWPVAGTTGYDALTEVSNLFVDTSVETQFTDLYRDLTGDSKTYAEHVAAGKRMVVGTILRAEVSRMARLAPHVPLAEQALAELLIGFPVYRSYLPMGSEHLARAIEAARIVRPDLSNAIASLTSRLTDPADELAQRFQQTSGAVMAKGVEDTAYYRYSRFIALNEVGGDPARFGALLEDFHAAQAIRQRVSPAGMTTLSTHDTKRGEDVRARLFALAELSTEWDELARDLMERYPTPNPAFGYLLWQTVVGTTTGDLISRDRLHAYAEKAMREAADGTGWIDPVTSFEDSVHSTVDAAFDDVEVHNRLMAFASMIGPAFLSNSLSQKLVQLTMPGVPDVYQGTDLWEDSLVDPDNRRPVDYAARRSLLESLDAPAQLTDYDSGLAKLRVVAHTLRLRRSQPELFDSYTPLLASGAAADHVVAFDRGGAITVATRLPIGLARLGGWQDTSLVLEGSELLTGRKFSGVVAVADLLSEWPVALIVAS